MIIGKDNKERTVPISNDTYESLLFLSPENTLIHKDNKPLCRISVTQTIQALTKKVLKQSYSAHDFWHTFCSRLYKKTKNIKAISKIVGHSTTAITLDMYPHTYFNASDISFNTTHNWHQEWLYLEQQFNL